MVNQFLDVQTAIVFKDLIRVARSNYLRMTLFRTVRNIALVFISGIVSSHSTAVEVRYELLDDAVTNPERGFYEQFTAGSEGEPLKLDELRQLREQGVSLLLRLYYLEKFREVELSPQQLSLIESDFSTLR